MSTFIDKAARYHGEKRITLSGSRTLTEQEQISGTLIFEGTLSANAEVRFRDQPGGYWFVYNATSGGKAVVVSGLSGAKVYVPPLSCVLVTYVRNLGMLAVWAPNRKQILFTPTPGTYTVQPYHDLVLCTGSAAGVINLNLPDAVALGDGHELEIRDKGDAGAYGININTFGSQTVEYPEIVSGGGWMRIITSGGNWYTIDRV